jgi:signal transduction histidine kinase
MDLRAILTLNVKTASELAASWGWHAFHFAAAALMCCMACSEAEAGDASTKQPKDWFNISKAEALQGQPVEFQGTVLCYDLGWGQFYIHDGSNTVYFSPRCFTNRFEVGQLVTIKGRTTWDETGATLTNATAAVIGDQLLPQPAALRLSELSKSYGQWIETRGQVRVAEASRERVTLILKDGDQECLVYVMQSSSATKFKNLVDCWVRIQGINASRIENGRLDAAIVFLPGMSQVKVINPSQTDRWQLPVTAIDTLLAQPPGDWTNQPVHINGLISAYKPGSGATITDPTGLLNAEVIQVNQALPYQRIDAWGFLCVKTNQTVLTDAYFEINGDSHKKATSVAETKQDIRNEPALTSIKQIRSLSKEKADENLPARIRGVLTCVDLDWRIVFLQDGHDAIFLDTGQSDLQPGQWVEVTGQTDGRGFAPQLINCSTQILGMTNRPSVAKVDLQDVVSGQLDSQWVELEGVVRRINKENGRISLTLASPNGKFTAIVRDFNSLPAPDELVDSFISLRGACGSTVNSRGQISGITLHVPSRKEITIIDPSPSDPFSISSTPISKVATFNTEQLAGRRIKITGVVTLITPDRSLFVQDASGGMRIHGAQIGPVHVSEQIEAVGFTALSEFSPTLQEAVIRHVGPGAVPEAIKTTAREILQSGKRDGMLVELEAKFLQNLSEGAQHKFAFQDGPIIFTAELGQSGFQDSMPNLSPGSRVRVRGVCAIQGNENNEPTTFHVLAAETGGIVVLKGAPWWTPQHAMMLLGGTILGVLLASVWVLSLRRQVRSQTEIIRQNQRDLIDKSRQAGMAEVATSVLHNVGNVLNSINIAAALTHERIRKSKVVDVRRLANLIEEHSEDRAAFLTSDPRGRNVPEFLSHLGEALLSEQAAMLEELTSLRGNVEHVNEIIAMQQSYAKVSGVFEDIQVGDLLENTLRMNLESFERHHVKVVRDFSPLPPICTDQHKVLQILINLVRNAQYACDDSGRTDKQVILRATNGGDRVKIAIIDNGVGIPPENLTRIFNHGFTTRKNGHGFGLHSGALAAKELGGSLTVNSEGLGHGAMFTLELPCHRPCEIKPKSPTTADIAA